ncbi:hypothetical protein CC1G_10330 [Coprinopsis cinerea okayama7|uniref:AAA+ ATPase domain-containing protein n=1 Tax=Coprinopsis cinerea (strain Okayama-7 / 130 / ATCC MYA-4618 / FGSC 9003) TaxID=240176 RepID=A8P0K0_COPC7|nr:hypothetical protein CC1G_10330 [Coprinopsis cinerea okayama7\|eukprot:XP_001837909.2 hypothetical protein CC1G_10330 [Coprinopsis cinerea okayama7\
MGEIVGVLSNPASTVRSLTESKRLLEEARREIQETRERSQIRPTHTFSRLPGFFPRRAEQQAIQRSLEGEPSFTVLFGPPSAGKTALLREILSHPRYHVLHFDLRIAGFADLESLYTSLSLQMEGFFEELAQNGGWYEEGSSEKVEMTEDELKAEGWDRFEREAWGFKHDRLNLERRLGSSSDGEGGAAGPKAEVRPSDIARLMELFQSSLLRYREFQPSTERKSKRRQNSEDTTVVGSSQTHGSSAKKRRWFSRKKSRSKEEVVDEPMRHSSPEDEERKLNRRKRVPVIFFDEAHKLPHLIPSAQTMQTILDSTLVLTKQDRLCHVVHATSDPFYQGWLSRVGVLWYCKMIAIGDLSKSEMRAYYNERVKPRLETLPPNVRRLDFETLWDAFGGKVAHWYDFVTDHVKQSSHFLQAHALLNLHIIHSSQAPGGGFDSASPGANTTAGSIHHGNAAANLSTEAHRASPETVLHPSLGPAGFRMYNQPPPSQANLGFFGGAGGAPLGTATVGMNPLIASFTPYEVVGTQPDFSPMQLLKVMSRFTTGGLTYLPYFHLCRELGAKAVDGMIRGKVVDMKWTEGIAVTAASTVNSPVTSVPPRHAGWHAQDPTLVQHQEPTPVVEFGSNPPPPSIHAHTPSHTAPVQPPPIPQGQPPPPFTEEDEGGDVMVPVSEEELLHPHSHHNAHAGHAHSVHSHQTHPIHPLQPQASSTASFGNTINTGGGNHPINTPTVGTSTMLPTATATSSMPMPHPIHYGPPPPRGYHDDMVDEDDYGDEELEEEEVIGPKIMPVSPIMRYAMREVIKEYEDDQSVSEYASLSDFEEY